MRQTIEGLESELSTAIAENLSLKEMIKALTSRVTMNSSNSSKPPSSDGYRKPKPQSLREKSGKQRCAQLGHPGYTLDASSEPDEVVEHLPARCETCPQYQSCSSRGVFECDEDRYVIEAVTATRLVKHSAIHADCPCGYRTAAEAAGILEISVPTVDRATRCLSDKGLIRRERSKKTGTWVPVG